MLTLNEFKTDYNQINQQNGVESHNLNKPSNNAIEYLVAKFPETASIFKKFDESAIKEVNIFILKLLVHSII